MMTWEHKAFFIAQQEVTVEWIAGVLDLHGARGWELVGAVPGKGAAGDTVLFLMKRPRDGSGAAADRLTDSAFQNGADPL